MPRVNDKQRTRAMELVSKMSTSAARDQLMELGCTKSQANNLIRTARKKAGLYKPAPKEVAKARKNTQTVKEEVADV